jgi:hypothetical protein
MSHDIFYFELFESRTGRLRLEFTGTDIELRGRGGELGREHYRADEIGISNDSIYTYLAVSDDLYVHIGIYGHHEDEDGIPSQEWSEEKRKYENMKCVRQQIESEWNEIAQTLEGRSSQLSSAIAAINNIDF